MKKNHRKFAVAVIFLLVSFSSLPAQTFNELTGYLLTPTAGTLPETEFKIEAHSGMLAGTIIGLDFSGMLGEFVGGLGASFIYGMSKNVEIGLNVQSFDEIYSGGALHIPQISLNTKINFLPKFDDTGLGLGFQLLSYNSGTIYTLPDLYVLWTTVIQEAVGLSMQVRPFSGFDVNSAIVVAPRNSTNLILEMHYHSGTLILMPEIKIGSTDGLQLKLGSLFNLSSIDVDTIGVNISCGIKF